MRNTAGTEIWQDRVCFVGGAPVRGKIGGHKLIMLYHFIIISAKYVGVRGNCKAGNGEDEGAGGSLIPNIPDDRSFLHGTLQPQTKRSTD